MVLGEFPGALPTQCHKAPKLGSIIARVAFLPAPHATQARSPGRSAVA